MDKLNSNEILHFSNVVGINVPPAHCISSNVPRIDAFLSMGLHQKFMFLDAPQGFGKTNILSRWLRNLNSQQHEGIWLNLSYFDNAKAVIKHLCLVLSNNDKDIVKIFQSISLVSDESIKKLSLLIIKYIDTQSEIVIVFDNYRKTHCSQGLEQVLTFINFLPTNVHAVLSLNFKLLKYDLKHTIIDETPFVVSALDLAYEYGEYMQVILSRLPKLQNKALLDKIYAETLGWPAVIDEAISLAIFTNISFKESFERVKINIHDYFNHEYYPKLSKEAQELLELYALIGDMNPKICNYIRDKNDSLKILDSLVSANQFLFQAGKKSEDMQLHPLLTEWILNNKLNYSKASLRNIHSKAAYWYARHGMKVEAAIHQILSCDRENLLNLVNSSYPNYKYQDLVSLISLENLRLEAEASSPLFSLLTAWAYIFVADIDLAYFWINECMSSHNKLDDNMLLGIETMKVKILSLQSDSEQIFTIISKLESKLLDIHQQPLRLILSECKAEYYDLSRSLPKCLSYHQKVAAAIECTNFNFIGSINHYEIALNEFLSLQFNEAKKTCLYIRERYPEDFPCYQTATALYRLITALLIGSDKSSSKFDDLPSISLPYRNPDMYIDLLIAQSVGCLLNDEVLQAERIIIRTLEWSKLQNGAIPRAALDWLIVTKRVVEIFLEAPIASQTAYEKNHTFKSKYSLLTYEFLNLISYSGAVDKKALVDILAKARELDFRLLELFVLKYLISCCYYSVDENYVHYTLELVNLLESRDLISLLHLTQSDLQDVYIAFVSKPEVNRSYKKIVSQFIASDAHSSFELTKRVNELFKVDLTERESDVLTLVAQEYQNKDIADLLHVSQSTVKSHLSHLYTKFNVRNKKELLQKLNSETD